MRLNINSREIVEFTNKLEKMHKKHLPNVVRKTLNNIALEGVKKKTLLNTTSKTFTTRQKNFFKANSRVDFATGFNVKSMKSQVGMVSNKLKGGNNFAVKDLEKQEEGGKIGGRSFVPLKHARVGNSWNRNVRKKFRISNIRDKIIDSRQNAKGRNSKQKWLLSSVHAGTGGFVIGTKESGGGTILFHIRKIAKKKRGFKVKAVPIYSVQGNRTVNVKKTRFMEKSANLAGKDLDKVFIKMAKNELVR